MVKKNRMNPLIIAVIIIAVILMVQKGGIGLFALLPLGDSRANGDCTFITNVPSGDTYLQPGAWVSLDKGSGMEGFGFVAASNFVCPSDDFELLSTQTIEGYPICERIAMTEWIVIDLPGETEVLFSTTDPDADNAILSCDSGTPCNNPGDCLGGAPFCGGGNVWDSTFACTGGFCDWTANPGSIRIETCEFGCTNGECNTVPGCSTDADCPEGVFLGTFCSGGNVWDTFRDNSCVSSECVFNDIPQEVENCGGLGCSGGQCNAAPGCFYNTINDYIAECGQITRSSLGACINSWVG